MKHRRGIDLTAPVPPARYEVHLPSASVLETVGGLRDWQVLGAKCGKCGHTAWLDRNKLVAHIGNHYLQNIGHKLVCKCGNRAGNKVLLGTLGRD